MFRLIAIFGCALGLGALCGCGAAGPARDALIAPPDAAAGLPASAAADFALEVLPESCIGGGRATLSVDIHPLIAGSGAAPVAALSGADGAVRQSHSGAGLRARHPDAGVTPALPVVRAPLPVAVSASETLARPAAEPSGGESALRVDIYAEDASGLRALYCDLHYDPARWQPLSAEPAPAFGATDKLLTLAVLDEPGVAHYGQLLIHPLEQPGFSGSGVLASLRFTPIRSVGAAFMPPAAGSGVRSAEGEVNLAPTGHRAIQPLRAPSAAPAETFPLVWWNADEIKWPYVLRGDTDQNGEVGIADLTPIGMHFGKTIIPGNQGFSALGDTPEEAADADGNYEVGIADLTPVGANFGALAPNSYAVYTSLDPSDYPADSVSANGPGASQVASIPWAEWRDSPAWDESKVLKFFVAPADPQQGAAYFWVRGEAGGPGLEVLSELLQPITAKPPLGFYNEPYLGLEPSTSLLGWWYVNSGDCNQDGLVCLGDAELVGQNLGVVDISLDSFLYMVDTDFSHEVNIADLSRIGYSISSQVLGYRVYGSDVEADYYANGGELLGTVPFESAIGNPSVEHLRFEFSLDPWPVGQPKAFVWVVPYCWSGEEGVKSILVTTGPVPTTLTLTNPPAVGSGTQADPFVLDPSTDYIFLVEHPWDGDVSTSPDTVYTPSVALEAPMGAGVNLFNVPDGLVGSFSIAVTYKGSDTDPPELYFVLAGG